MNTTARLLAVLLTVAMSGWVNAAGSVELRLDGWESGQNAGFQGGFAAGEIAAVRLAPPEPGLHAVTRISFLFGGDTGTRNIVLRIWDDGAGELTPGLEIFAREYQVTGSNVAIQEIDLSNEGVFVSGPFRVGIEMTAGGFPGPARDDDGSIAASDNFILADIFGWLNSNLLGVTGDWIIRAEVEQQSPLVQEFRNDAWPPSVEVGFQQGFAVGDMAAVRVVPEGPCPCTLSGVSVLFGGGSGSEDVILRVWEDDGSSVAPGTELFSGTFPLVGANAVINVIDLSAENIVVNGAFRFGFEFTHTGLPAIARDTDGYTQDSNFINDITLGWRESDFFGLQGDWIMRAVLSDQLDQVSELGIDDWAPVEIAAFQEGFVAGEIAASRLEADFPCPCRVDGVRFLFGGTTDMADVTLRIWEDAAGTAVPGTEVYSGTVNLTGNNLLLNDVDLSGQGIWVNGPFRLGLEFQQAGLPSIARDHDGVVPGRNFIQLDDGSWVDATVPGVPGDWILRAQVFQEVLSRLEFE